MHVLHLHPSDTRPTGHVFVDNLYQANRVQVQKTYSLQWVQWSMAWLQ